MPDSPASRDARIAFASLPWEARHRAVVAPGRRAPLLLVDA